MTSTPGRDPVTRAVGAWLDQYAGSAAPIVVACSGGADSLALALAVRQFSGSRPVLAATVDHGLQAGSADRAAGTAELLNTLGYRDAAVLTVTVDGSGGPEAAARRARYAALERYADTLPSAAGPPAVLLGHTADDQAETVLLGLARGSGPRSIAGMRPWRPPWGRPLLRVRRGETENLCRAAGLAPWQDPHNTDPAYTRVRLRHEVLPLLEDILGGGVAEALARTARLMTQDLEALDALAAVVGAVVRRPDGTLDASELAAQPPAVIGRVLRIWTADGGAGPLSFEQLSRMVAQVADGRPEQVRLPGGKDVIRTGGTLRLVSPSGRAG